MLTKGISHRSKLVGRGTIQLSPDIPSPKERPWYDSLRLLMYLGWVFHLEFPWVESLGVSPKESVSSCRSSKMFRMFLLKIFDLNRDN